MKNISKMMKSLIIGALIMNVTINEAKAFFLTPPMPWDIELDLPANANKIISNFTTLCRQYETVASELNTNKLQAIKKAMGVSLAKLKNELPSSEGKGKAKTPMKKETKGNAELGISDNDLNEKHYFDAYYQLFLVYPEMEGDGQGQISVTVGNKEIKADYPVLQTAYKHKTTQYRQDVIVNTYLTGRLTEDYLSVVDKTLQRLERCLNLDWEDAGLNEKKCTFFGLHMVKVKNNTEIPSDPDGDNAGQLGAAMNAYVVTTVYDRLLRIVEDLTATEAIYRAAKQLDLADPITPEQQSSAEKYIHNTYQFAHNEVYNHTHAQSLLNPYKRSDACANGGENCPDSNKDKAELLNVDNTDVLGKLSPIDAMLNRALRLHNLKNRLPEYKAQYRRYKKAEEIHDRALKVLEQSDQCVQEFLGRHGGNAADWGASPEANDYKNRTGISGELIKAYENAVKQNITGETGKCEGFYSSANSCPDGYKLDEKEFCQYEEENEKGEIIIKTDKAKHPCILETVAYDAEDDIFNSEEDEKNPEIPDEEKNQAIPDDYEEAGANFSTKISSNNDMYDNANYLIDSGNADKMELENRKKAEQIWRVGYDKITELAKADKLKFDPWVDQQNFQKEYLHNKYRNLRMIIESVDQGVASYKIASKLEEKTVDTSNEPVEALIKAITFCLPLEEAREKAYKQYCAGYPKTATDKNGETVQLTCSASKDDNTGKITVIKEKEENGVITKENIPLSQVVSYKKSCDYHTEPKEKLTVAEDTDKCGGNWDFTVKSLVKDYFPVVLGNCSENPEQAFYDIAKSRGRRVATDYLIGVMNERKNGEQDILNLVREYDETVQKDKAELQARKDAIREYNVTIDEKTKEKNWLITEVERTNQRVKDIEKEKDNINERLKSDLLGDKDKCSLNVRIALLDNIKECITEEEPNIDTEACPKECSDKKEIKEIQCRELKKFDCEAYKRDIDYKEYSKPEESVLTFVIPSLAKPEIDSRNDEIEYAKASRDTIRASITALEEDIKRKAADFTQNYLTKVNEQQAAIDTVNNIFEDFLEPADGESQDVVRMKNINRKKCTAPYTEHCIRDPEPIKLESDNLKTTLTEVTYHGAESLEDAIKYGTKENENLKSLNSVWFQNMDVTSLKENLQNIGVPATFVIDGTLGLEAGPKTLEMVAEAIADGDIKERVLDQAATKIAGRIEQADKIIAHEVEEAVKEINDMAESLGVKDTRTTSDTQMKTIYDDETVTAMHLELINKLKEPSGEYKAELSRVGVTLENLFGMTGANTSKDKDYFVGLPARGINYIGKEEYEKESGKTDDNAGRDFRAPKEPLANLPPLREVFYYGPLDYDDTPKEKDGKEPAISYLLNKKYPDSEKIEYLPEIWRYLLARPNMREDGKYQRTFIERSLGNTNLQRLLDGPDGNPNNYRTIISRAGIYPCQLGNATIDIVGTSDSISGMRYVYRGENSTPQQEGASAMSGCQEVAFNNITGTSCYTYNKGRGGICHLMADHGKKDIEDGQTALSQTTQDMFKDYSELGQFLDKDLKYRSLHKNILQYQIDMEENKNDINRRKAMASTFTRNVMGSFLEAVSMEHRTKENLDKMEVDIERMFKSLCEELHKAEWTITGDEEETAEVCAKEIMKQGGLAKNGNDNKYGETGEYDDASYEKITCPSNGSLYENIFCNLKAMKAEALEKVRKGYTYKDKETGKEVKVAGYDEVKEEADERIQERIDNINRYIDMLEKDAQEVVYITPNMTVEELDEDMETAKKNRTLTRIAEDEGIKSMDNQSQQVAYCPIY